MSERDAFIRAICDQPADDTARLVFADWLDENPLPEKECPSCHGRKFSFTYGACAHCKMTGTVPDAANANLAEFIRLQCASQCNGYGNSPSEENASKCGCSICARQRELLTANCKDWLPACMRCEGKGYTGTRRHHTECDHCRGTNGHPGECRRGFAYSVPVRMADVFEHVGDRKPCPECTAGKRIASTGRREWEFVDGKAVPRRDCGRCNNARNVHVDWWQPTAKAIELLREWPSVERMPVVDKLPEPWVFSEKARFSWYMDGFPDDLATLPEFLFDALEGYDDVRDGRKIWYALEAAKDALARGVVRAIRG